MHLGRFDAARAAFDAALRIGDDDAAMAYRIARLFARFGRVDVAADYLRAALAADPKHGEAGRLLRQIEGALRMRRGGGGA